MTAYELRISDSSSDVCSSDLALGNDDTVLDELHQGAKTAPAVEHFKRTTRLLDRIYEQVLEYAARFDIGGQLRNFEKLFGARAYVDRRKRKLRKLYRYGHRMKSFWRPEQPGHRQIGRAEGRASGGT